MLLNCNFAQWLGYTDLLRSPDPPMTHVCRRLFALPLAALASLALLGVTGDTRAAASAARPVPLRYPLLFAAQVPPRHDHATRFSAFANHLPGVEAAPRGGDLMLRYPDGRLRNLTREAGFGSAGEQGDKAIAVREPAVHWDGRRALFSMVVGSGPRAFWQVYEARGLGRGERVRIGKVAGQPADANNLSPFYATDGRILFTSDRPRSGMPHLYPQLDEYEATPTTTGIWSLEPASGRLRILNHTPSGAFNPFVDSFGRIVFVRWDHLQQDQLAQRDRDAQGNRVALPFKSFNYAGEALGAPALATRAEAFPESRTGDSGRYGTVSAFTTNFFTAWQMNEDGSGEETLNHVGQHELAFGHFIPSFRDDSNLSDRSVDRLHANRSSVRREGGLFQLAEEPRRPGSYLAVAARDRDTYATGQLVRLGGAPGLNPEKMTVAPLTAGHPGDALPGGRFRNPLALADGTLVASHAPEVDAPAPDRPLAGLRLVRLEQGRGGLYRAGAPLTPGIERSVWWRGAQGQERWSGVLWEAEAVELRPRPRPRPARSSTGLEAPERAVLAGEGVEEDALRRWLRARGLALIVTRDQTSRDRAELQQPFNLRVPGGVKTVSRDRPGGRTYDIAHFQLFQGDQVRAYADRPGRRVLAQPLHEAANPANPGGPPGSVRIARDGSTAALVPAGRALTWQTTDPQGGAVVRERNWITFQAGEMRVCASCHGVNRRDQAGRFPPLNQPEALRQWLKWWKSLPK
jgi:hypothetical protein